MPPPAAEQKCHEAQAGIGAAIEEVIVDPKDIADRCQVRGQLPAKTTSPATARNGNGSSVFSGMAQPEQVGVRLFMEAIVSLSARPYSALEREAQRKLQLPREVRLARDFAKLAATERHVGTVEQRRVHGV